MSGFSVQPGSGLALPPFSSAFIGRKGSATSQLVGNGSALVNGTFWFTLNAPVPFTITGLTHKTSAGTFTADIQINGVSVTGLSAVSVTTSKTTTAATVGGNNVSVVEGDVITVVVTSATGTPTDAVLSLNYTQS